MSHEDKKNIKTPFKNEKPVLGKKDQQFYQIKLKVCYLKNLMMVIRRVRNRMPRKLIPTSK